MFPLRDRADDNLVKRCGRLARTGYNPITVVALLLLLFQQDVDALLRDLESEDPATRERAFEELISRGGSVVPAIRGAFGKTADPDLKFLLSRLISSLDWWSSDRLVATVPREDAFVSAEFSRRGRTVTCVFVARKYDPERLNWFPYVSTDGEQGEPFDEVRDLTLSADGSSFAYRAKLDNREFVVLGDRRFEEFHNVDRPTISPDGKTVAYAACSAEAGWKWFVVNGDRRGEPFDRVLLPEFCAGGEVAYQAWLGKKDLVVVGGRRGPEYDDVGRPIVSPDGKTVAYMANVGGSPGSTGRNVGGEWFVVVGDKRGESFDAVDDVVFSPDSKTVAYSAERDGRSFVIVGDRKLREFARTWYPGFSPDGTRVAYLADEGKGVFPVIDEEVGEAHDGMGDIIFSPDGNHVAYEARKGCKGFVVADGKKGREFSTVRSPIVWGPDGRHLAYRVREGDAWHMVVGESTSEPFDQVWKPEFSADGARVGFGARRGHELWWIVKAIE